VWVITYWAEVLELCTTPRKAWMQAEEFIRLWKKAWKKSDDGENRDEIMQEAYDMLLCIPWSGNIRGFDHNEPLYKLAMYASHAWLATTHKNQILDFLHCDILLQGSKIEIANMDFFPGLCKAYNQQDTGEYDESCGFAWVHGIGKALVARDCDGLGTMVNIDGDHWVAFTLNFEQATGLVWRLIWTETC